MTTAPARPAPTPAAQSADYAELCRLLREAATLGSIGSLLGWDQETYMPHAAADHRAEQSSLISALAHERSTSPRIGELLARCEADRTLTGDKTGPEAANLREIRRDYDLATKLPTELVAELAKVGSQAQEAWKDARARNDFAAFAPWLEKMMTLTRRKAECYGVPAGGSELYDALLDEYEPGVTAKMVEATFQPLEKRLSALVKDLAQGKGPDESVLNLKIDPARQHELGRFVLRAMGFDLGAGRLDTTTHPFCSGMAPGDTRLTTRYRDERFTDALYGTMHEAGHGLYEQGLPKLGPGGTGEGRFGQPLGSSISLGIHESQSRMWENFVGRSREFWAWLWPHVQLIAGPAADGFGVDDIARAVNTARPSLIRVEADEATYNLHVMIRFELERRLIAGDLKVKDLPGAWNAAYKRSLGVDVPDDRRGCLQDVHWSFGLVGYFPTYTLGNLYAAQLWEAINAAIPDLRQRIARGDFAALKSWLNTNVHAHGRRYRAADLCVMVTGAPLSADPLLRHLEGKLRPIYGR
jgi:carboxypeptidase Taq